MGIGPKFLQVSVDRGADAAVTCVINKGGSRPGTRPQPAGRDPDQQPDREVLAVDATVPTPTTGAEVATGGKFAELRYDPGLASEINGEPAEARIEYEHDEDGAPTMIVTFGPVMPTGGDWLPLVLQMRAHAGAPYHDATMDEGRGNGS